MKIIHTDVLVIGGGGAAGRAALEASRQGSRVIMAFKGSFTASGATAHAVSEMAGFNAGDGSADPHDSPEEHYRDILVAAQGVCIPELAEIVANNAVRTLETLESWGVPFEKDGSRYLVFKSCFSNRPRTHVIRGHGHPIMLALNRQILASHTIRKMENSMAVSLIVRDNKCLGGVFLDSSGCWTAVLAGATVLAAGGAGQLFQRNMNPPDITGDGYALGYEAGARLINMEFMQAGVGISYPTICLMSAYIWSGLPSVKNRYGDDILENGLPTGLSAREVMQDHARHFPFSCIDRSYHVETLMQNEIFSGRGTDENGLYLDLTHMTTNYVASIQEDTGLRKMWPIAREYYENIGLPVSTQPVQVACFAHAINGGLQIDRRAQTTVEGLYCAGENAGGPHGADRLGGNMLLTCQIFGEIAGKEASLRAKDAARPALSESDIAAVAQPAMERFHARFNSIDAMDMLKSEAQRFLLIQRTQAGLVHLLATIDSMEANLADAGRTDKPDIRNLEIHNMLTTARLMADAALARKESRGSHYRNDFPNKGSNEYERPMAIVKEST